MVNMLTIKLNVATKYFEMIVLNFSVFLKTLPGPYITLQTKKLPYQTSKPNWTPHPEHPSNYPLVPLQIR